MSKKKIYSKKKLIIFAPFMENGGIEKNLILLTNYFSHKNKNVVLITFEKKNKKFFNNKVKVIFPNFHLPNLLKSRNFINIICLLILVRYILNNRNSLVISFQSNLYVTLIAKIFNAKNIIRIASYGWMKNKFKKIIFYILLRLPTVIVVNSNEMKKVLKKEFNINTKCIYNPLDTKIINKSKFTKKKYFSASKKKLKILFLARLVDAKDPITFLKGIKKVNTKIKFQALIVGNGSMRNSIRKKIKEYNLNQKVKLLKYSEYPMQPLNQCNLLVLTSKFEGLPNVLIEAQYLKKYIISTNCKTGPKEILKNGNFGSLINVGDHNQLAKQIEFFYYNQNSKIIKKKIKLGFNHLYRFDLSLNCKKFQQIVEKY